MSDNGCGISAENIDHIFNPFFTTKAPDRGMGFGLAIVYRIIHDLQGTITVTSTPGEGATFVLGFPAAASVAAVATNNQRKIKGG